MVTKIVKSPIKKSELLKMAEEGFGDLVKAVVDIKKGIMVIGGELHADEEVLLMEKNGSKREDTWGINLYPLMPEEEFIEFDSMINIKPILGNRSRGVENENVRKKIVKIVHELIIS